MTMIEHTVMATTLMIRNAWVKPFQTVKYCQYLLDRRWGVCGSRTLSVVVEVCELIAPLCQNAQRILKESDNDQEAADSWQISIQGRISSIASWTAPDCRKSTLQAPQLSGNSRLNRVGQGIQEILDLVCLLSKLIKRAWVVCGAIVPSSVTEWALVSQVVARCAPYLRHDCGRKQRRRAEWDWKEWRWEVGYGCCEALP